MLRIVALLAIASLTLARPDESIVTGLQSAGQSSVNWVEGAAQSVGQFFSSAGKDVGQTAEQAWNATREKAGEFGNTLKGAAGTVADHGEHVASGAKNWVEGAVETVKRGGETAVTAAGNAWQELRANGEQGVTEGAKTVGDVVHEKEGEKTFFNKIGDWFKGIGK